MCVCGGGEGENKNMWVHVCGVGVRTRNMCV